jgi:hypothetical protein
MDTTHARPRDRAQTRRAIVAAGIAAAALFQLSALVTPAPAGASSGPAYGWPVKPFHRQHPVRGFFGDPRIGMTPKGMHSGFHFGIDISCPNGTPVYATLDGTVRLESFRPEVVTIVGRDDRTQFEYWHIRPAVANGAHVTAYRTLVGWAEPPWEHVHFSERRDGVYVNPLRPGALGPFRDTTRPWLKELRVDVERGGVSSRAAQGTVDLVVEAYDMTPIRVPGRWGGKPMTPSLLRWRLVTPYGAVVRGWRTAIDHRLVKPDDAAYTTQYAQWTRQNKRGRPGRYRFVLTASWDTRGVTDGVYLVEVAASDTRGNTGFRRFPIRIANRVHV